MYYRAEHLKGILASYKSCVFSLEHLCSSALEYIQQLESAQPKWISVDERLPEYDVRVLVAIPRYYGCDIRTARLYKSGAWLIGDMSAVGSTPTHWMPLPSTEGIE